MELDHTLLAPAAQRSDVAHVVYALSPAETGLFFSARPHLPASMARESWVNAEAFSPSAWEATLRSLRPSVLVTAWSCPLIPLSWALEDDCPLQYVCSVTGGVRCRVPRELIERGMLVTNWGVEVSQAVAEHAMLMVLALLRGVPQWGNLMNEHASMFVMMPKLRSRTLQGKRVGLHGFGAVARCLVGLLKPYEVELASYSEGVPENLFDEFGVRRCGTLAELFSDSEILIECEALHERSRGSVTAEILELLPDDAVFVNVGRGAVADESALAHLARAKRLRVGLDVFHKEPLAADSPLRDNAQILLSPHVAGPTWETYPLCGAGAINRLLAFLRGEVPDNRVTLEIYDRAT
jgi:phosphoglycerate dehydrogenase-like enzyme